MLVKKKKKGYSYKIIVFISKNMEDGQVEQNKLC